VAHLAKAGRHQFPWTLRRRAAGAARLVRLIAEGEPVHINIWDADLERLAKRSLEAAGVPLAKVQFHPFRAYEPWCRDHGPQFVVCETGARAIVNWGYNAWGGKYPPFDLNDAIPGQVASALGLCRCSSPR